MPELFSIVIPTFNSVDYCSESVRSALGQTYPNVEVVVDDNTSTDGTVEHLEAEFGSHPRFRLKKNKEDLNIPNGWNRALSHARGTYLLLLHSDNLLHPEYVSLTVAAMNQYQARVAYSDCKYFWGKTPADLFSQVHSPLKCDALSSGAGAVAYVFRFQRMIPTSGLTFHRDCFESRVPYDPKFRWDPDIEQMTWLAEHFGVLRIHQPLAAIRSHEGQAASWKDPTFSAQYQTLLKTVYEKGQTERHHYLLEWAASNEYIVRRLSVEGVRTLAFLSYLRKWLVAEWSLCGHFFVHSLRKNKLIMAQVILWFKNRLLKSLNLFRLVRPSFRKYKSSTSV